MQPESRRNVIGKIAGLGVGIALGVSASAASTAAPKKRKFTMDLTPGAIGVGGSQTDIIALAKKHGFESVQPNSGFLVGLDDGGRSELAEAMKQQGIVWGAAGLPVDFRKDEAKFRADIGKLPAIASAMQKAGVDRVSTWIMPCHDELTYVDNFRQHAQRLRECVRILADHGQRFGMEYVGPKTLWSSKRHSFIHTMAETKNLIAEIGQDNVGFVLDSWHWYTAHETVADLMTLSKQDIVACDLNDAPAGIEIDQQIDNQRELPSATGVIDLKAFLGALVEIGYDGPVRSEPFNKKLNALENDAACAATSSAMHKAFGLVGG